MMRLLPVDCHASSSGLGVAELARVPSGGRPSALWESCDFRYEQRGGAGPVVAELARVPFGGRLSALWKSCDFRYRTLAASTRKTKLDAILAIVGALMMVLPSVSHGEEPSETVCRIPGTPQ